MKTFKAIIHVEAEYEAIFEAEDINAARKFLNDKPESFFDEDDLLTGPFYAVLDIFEEGELDE